jgi:hypothetical protein
MPAMFDASGLVVEQHFVNSKDGTKVGLTGWFGVWSVGRFVGSEVRFFPLGSAFLFSRLSFFF